MIVAAMLTLLTVLLYAGWRALMRAADADDARWHARMRTRYPDWDTWYAKQYSEPERSPNAPQKPLDARR